MTWAKTVLLSFTVGVVGVGTGLMYGLAQRPAIVVEEKWRTITTAPQECPDLSHTSLNPDELMTLLTIMNTTTTTTRPVPVTIPPAIVVPLTLPPFTTTSTATTTTTTVPPTSTTTSEPPTTTTEEQLESE